MAAFTTEELPVPSTLEAPGAKEFAASIEVRNRVEAEVLGSFELAYSPAEMLPHWLDTEYEPKRLFVARVGEDIVARAVYETQASAPDVAWLTVEVLEEHRRRGMGSALLERIEAVANEENRAVRQSFALAQEVPGDRIAPPHGAGSLPLADPGVRFALAHGYALEQVERVSSLPLPVDPLTLAAHLETALTTSGPGYRVHTWRDTTPEHWREGLTVLLTRMSTDMPSAGLEAPEDPWTVERLLADERRHADDPRRTLIAAVEHVPTGQLAGFTELSVPPDLERAVTQEDTIVLHEHRGHRLGMLLKIANLDHLARARPGHPSVVTFNAEENRPMLSVNEAVGFVPIGYVGAWKAVR